MAVNKATFERALRFVQKKHRGQFRAGGMPAWHHLLRVSNLLRQILSETKEGPINNRFIIALSALGHDLLEDTKTGKEEIIDVFTRRGFELINGMTNPLGEKNHGPYIRSVARSEEAVRLIKLADLYDNFTSVLYNLSLLGTKWTISFFLPIVVPMHKKIIRTKFVRYKKAASRLIRMIDDSAQLLQNELYYQKVSDKNKKTASH